jgi:hypothetical protein
MIKHSFAALVRLSLVAVALVAPMTGSAWSQQGPAAEHVIFKADVGTWDATMKVFAAEGAEPTVGKATETNEMIGDLWLVSRFESELFGSKFMGLGTWGYDPAEKKYVGTWIDNMSPYPQTIRGDYDAATKTLTALAEGRDPASGEKVTYRETARTVDENTRVFEMFAPGKDGKYWKMLDVEYKRRVQ